MAFPFVAAAGVGLSAAGILGNIFDGGVPDFPVSEDDINRIFDLELNRALASTASGARRRLIGAGQGGSGAIDAVIGDLQSRLRSMFEERKQKALVQLRQGQFGRDVMSKQRTSQIFGGLAGLGANIFGLSSEGQQLLNPLGDIFGDVFNQQQPSQFAPQFAPQTPQALPQSPLEGFNQFQLQGGQNLTGQFT